MAKGTNVAIFVFYSNTYAYCQYQAELRCNRDHVICMTNSIYYLVLLRKFAEL